MMKWVLAIVMCTAVAYAGQGDRPKIKKVNVGSVDQKAPVTRSEAVAVFTRARKAIVAARIAQIATKPSLALGNQPVTRDEVISEMSKIFAACKKAVKFVPNKAKFDPSVFKVGASAKAPLTTLVGWGLVAPVGPVATGPQPGLTIPQFGDAVGFFLARISDVTHMPIPRWSPYLMPNDGE